MTFTFQLGEVKRLQRANARTADTPRPTTRTANTPRSTTRTALLLIDIQKAFSHPTHWGPRSNPAFESNVTALLAAVRAATFQPPPLIIHVAHNSKSPGSPLHPTYVFPETAPEHSGCHGTEFYEYVAPLPGELIITKNVNSAFIGTDLLEQLRAHGIRRLYVAGLTSDQCVSTTVRMAANLGACDGKTEGEEGEEGEVVLVGDATAAHRLGKWEAEVVQELHLATLEAEFCRLVSTADAIRELKK